MKKSVIALAALFAAVGAHALTVASSYNLPIVEATTELPPGGGSNGVLSLFDSNLGILTGATLFHGASATFSYSGTNNAAQAQTARITVETNVAWSSDNAAINGVVSLHNMLLTDNSGFQVYAVGETKNFGPSQDTDGHTDDLAAILASLQAPGGGTFQLNCETISGISVLGGGGNISTTQSTTAGCGGRIEYTYELRQQVPEPSSLALIGLALAGLAATRRRKV